MLGSGFSILLIILFPESRWTLWIGSIALGLFLASFFPTVFILAERRIPLTGTTTSMFFVGASLGGMFFPWFIGQLFETISPGSMMFILLGITLMAGILLTGLIQASGSLNKE
jgi:fucose permease